MSIQSEINRISGNVSDALDAIEDKGVTIPSGANSDDLADLIAQITGGGGVGGITQDQDGYLVLSSDAPSPAPGGGLEYEMGTWSPSEDVSRPSISFTNTHTSVPLYIMIADATGDSLTSTYTNIAWSFSYNYIFIGDATPVSPNPRYGQVVYMYRGANDTTTYSTVDSLMYNTSDETNANYVRYWATETDFKPSTNNTSRYWRAGRTYKWIAVWAPTA